MVRITSLILILLLSGCRTHTIKGHPGAEEAAIRMEESRQEYEDCVARREVGQPSCDALKALYQKDQDEYEGLIY